MRPNRSLPQQIAAVEVQIALVEADIELHEKAGWNRYCERIRHVRDAHLEAIQFTEPGDLRYEQGILYALNALLPMFGAGTATLGMLKRERERLLAEHRDLRKTHQSRQDADLSDRNPPETEPEYP